MKQKDKQMISQLEKKLKAEQEARAFVEKQLMEEKKRKKLEEATAARAVAFAAATRYVVLLQKEYQLQKMSQMMNVLWVTSCAVAVVPGVGQSSQNRNLPLQTGAVNQGFMQWKWPLSRSSAVFCCSHWLQVLGTVIFHY